MERTHHGGFVVVVLVLAETQRKVAKCLRDTLHLDVFVVCKPVILFFQKTRNNSARNRARRAGGCGVSDDQQTKPTKCVNCDIEPHPTHLCLETPKVNHGACICSEAAHGAANVAINLDNLLNAGWHKQRRCDALLDGEDNALVCLDANGGRTELFGCWGYNVRE